VGEGWGGGGGATILFLIVVSDRHSALEVIEVVSIGSRLEGWSALLNVISHDPEGGSEGVRGERKQTFSSNLDLGLTRQG
jgi:hypothetical protein